jgi:hypothetical protein
MGAPGNKRDNYDDLSWSDKRQILKEALIGNAFTRLFLATTAGSGRSGIKAALGKKTTINIGQALKPRVANNAIKIVESLKKRYISPMTGASEKTMIAKMMKNMGAEETRMEEKKKPKPNNKEKNELSDRLSKIAETLAAKAQEVKLNTEEEAQEGTDNSIIPEIQDIPPAPPNKFSKQMGQSPGIARNAELLSALAKQKQKQEF